MNRITCKDVLREFKTLPMGQGTTTRRIAARILYKRLVCHPERLDLSHIEAWLLVKRWNLTGVVPKTLLDECNIRVRASVGWLVLNGNLKRNGKTQLRRDYLGRSYRSKQYIYTGNDDIGHVIRTEEGRRLAAEIKNADAVTALLCRQW